MLVSSGDGFMNGRRRFLVGTVLSIQNSSFLYPSCQNCCSRLIRTSCRYECRKCGATYKDATHRYKLCVKVSEEHTLHVITIFGKCLEQIFGGSADSLHSHLQVSSQLSGDLEHDKAQELLFQAAEHCLIGRSFIFAVKIPEISDKRRSFPHSNLSRNIVACQIILLNEDPMSCTVLSYFNRLVASVLSNDPIHTNTDVSTDTINRDLSDLGFSEGNLSLHQSWNHYADYWQQSLGLVSSPLSGTLAESQCSNYRAEQAPYSEALTSPNTTVCMQRILNGTDMATHSSSISTSGVKYSSSKHIHTNTHSPPSSAQFHSFCSKSKMALGQESYLQNVCKSGSRRSQSCSAHSMQLPPQTAEIYQAKEEIWEDFPFSESLSEFIANIEDSENIRPSEIKPITSLEEKLFNGKERPCNSMNIPDAQSPRNFRVTKDASHCSFDKCPNNESSTCVFNHLCETAGSNDTGLEDQTLPSVDLTLGSFQESLEKRGPSDVFASQKQDRQSPTKVLSSGTYSDDSLDLCSFIEDLDKSAVSLEKGISSHRRIALDEPKSSDGDTGKLRCTMTKDNYNASADLFEVSNNPEDEGTSQSQRIASPNSGQGRCLVSSLCTDVLPYQHRDSRISVSSLSENHKTWNKLTAEDFIPYFQSTPLLKRLPGTGRLAVDAQHLNMSCTSSARSRTLRHILLKNMKQQKPAMLYGLSENCSLWSPNSSPFSNSQRSAALIPKNKRTTLAHKPRKKGAILENKDNYNNQTCGNNDAIACTGKRTDSRKNGREDSIKHNSETLENVQNLSPVNGSLQEGEDQLLTSGWSPELFSGKSDISQPSDCLQRRLF